MKKFFLVLAFSVFCNGHLKAQLDSITFIDLPCYGAVGVTGQATTNQDTNAVYYEWSIGNGSSNSVWFNGSIGPVQTALASVNLSLQMAQQFYIICVTSFSACCTSNTFCDTIFGTVAQPVFSVNNSNIGIPNDSGLYAVDSLECPGTYIWTITGDATFNNGTQVTGTSGTSVNLNFGPGFTTGYLCVAGISNFGLMGDTVCMEINAPLGIEENTSNITSVYYQQSLNQINIQFNSSNQLDNTIKIVDVTGREVLVQQFKSGNGNNATILSTANLKKGIYFAEVNNIKNRKTLKFLKTE